MPAYMFLYRGPAASTTKSTAEEESDARMAAFAAWMERTGPALVDAIVGRLPEGPLLYPEDMVTDVPEAFWVAELVREQLLAVTHDEVPHSIACRVTEWEWPRIRCEILVERDSQKGIVIGRDGAVLREVGIRTRAQLPPVSGTQRHSRQIAAGRGRR